MLIRVIVKRPRSLLAGERWLKREGWRLDALTWEAHAKNLEHRLKAQRVITQGLLDDIARLTGGERWTSVKRRRKSPSSPSKSQPSSR